ncbi:MAG: family 16 glycoside hydrolase [Planctomycetota bacterium]|nr:family 16 glycoside hydrolase [Planctomycetota bacterium]
MKTIRLLPVLAVLFTLPAVTSEDKKEEFRPLFNGKNLDGWVKVNTAPSTWTIKDGMIICSGKPTGELRTTRMYQNFIMEVEWRHMRARGNAGIFVWADDITARGQPFHRSVEVQVLENSYGNTRGYTTHGDIFPIHGAKMTPINGRGGSRAFPTENRSKPTPEWNHYRITCNDGTISLAVNGKVVTNGKNASPRKGYICLESEGGIVHYRNLKIRELPDTPLEPGQTAIADRGYRCLYTGVDLSGWKSAGKGWQSRNWTFRYNGKSKVDDKSLVTTESFSDFGFIFDVQAPKKPTSCKVLLRDSAAAAITIDSNLKSKGWNRFEGELRGNKLSLKLNGKQLFADKIIEGLAEKGPIRIVPTGPVGFANIYVRELKAKTP